MREGTQTGNFDFSIVNMSVMSNFIPEYGVFDLPYIFESQEHADNVFLGEIGPGVPGYVRIREPQGPVHV